MTIKSLIGRKCSNRHIARLLGVSEGTVRYHRRRQGAGTADGRSGQQPVAGRFHEAIEAYVVASEEESPSNVAALHAWLVAEHDYPTGLRSVQRYVRRAYPAPARRARRRVETPAGVQAQADWASFPGVWVGGARRDLLAFVLTLSFSRAWALVWSERKHLLAWLSGHTGRRCPPTDRTERLREPLPTQAASAGVAPQRLPGPTLSMSRPFRAAGTSVFFRSAFSATPQRHRCTLAP